MPIVHPVTADENVVLLPSIRSGIPGSISNASYTKSKISGVKYSGSDCEFGLM